MHNINLQFKYVFYFLLKCVQFYGQKKQSIVCYQCAKVSTSMPVVCDFALPLPAEASESNATEKGTPLTTCIDMWCVPESIDDYHCSQCKAQVRATKKNDI